MSQIDDELFNRRVSNEFIHREVMVVSPVEQVPESYLWLERFVPYCDASRYVHWFHRFNT